MATAYGILDSVYGPCIAWADEDGALTDLFIGVERGIARAKAHGDPRDDLRFDEVASQLAEYGRGTRRRFDLKLRPRGTGFQLAVWNALTEIPFGETASYGAIAEKVGHPGKARAVGAANGANPIMLIIPCHRVIGADGSLTGFGGGLPLKQRMLAFEREYSLAADDLFAGVADA
ncbi:MAG TPA: methylated-DNA--[protein]-cysteine S-methyltransferase [Caulobacteraceae bacterium]|jgi:methylated-DNA-[protein]-cysteine S-methyltransferase|nr:methylated-DNA--[protein]-cysteine S-methyltransferase [Caulobacteraceae bacterium]